MVTFTHKILDACTVHTAHKNECTNYGRAQSFNGRKVREFITR